MASRRWKLRWRNNENLYRWQVIAKEQKKFDFFGDNEADVRIGCAKAVPHLTFMNGSIDEAAVWQRALSDNEIKQAMTGNFLAVSPKDKVATTWADVKRRFEK